MRFHPRKRDLFRHAESLVDGGVPIRMEVQRHVAQCDQCRTEVESMGESLRFMADAPGLAPSEALTAEIMASARLARHAHSEQRRSMRVLWRTVQVGAYAIGVVVVAVISFQAALAIHDEPVQGSPTAEQISEIPRTVVADGPTPEAIRRVSSEYRELASVLDAPAGERQSAEEWKHRRTALALDSDLTEALAALERNPGCARASQLATASLQRQVDALKSLYVERAL